jgi:hypothetical protein
MKVRWDGLRESPIQRHPDKMRKQRDTISPCGKEIVVAVIIVMRQHAPKKGSGLSCSKRSLETGTGAAVPVPSFEAKRQPPFGTPPSGSNHYSTHKLSFAVFFLCGSDECVRSFLVDLFGSSGSYVVYLSWPLKPHSDAPLVHGC